jgi:hypothetical protein
MLVLSPALFVNGYQIGEPKVLLSAPGQATQRLPLSSLGFLQYMSPSIQFLLAPLALPPRWAQNVK